MDFKKHPMDFSVKQMGESIYKNGKSASLIAN